MAQDDVDLLDEEDLDTQDPPERDVGQYGTDSGRSLAYSTYSKYSADLPKLDAEEEVAFQNYEKSARQIRAQLQQARDKLLSRKKSKSQALLAAAAGLLQPTRTGGFAESAGNALSAALPALQKEDDAADARGRQALDLDSAIGGIDQNITAQRLKLIQARRSAASKVLAESLRIASKPNKPGAQLRAQSTYGKIAADEGLRQSTPEFRARVDELRAQDQALARERSGVDVDAGLGDDDRRALADRFGVPVSAVDPYQGLSTKARQAAQQRTAQQSQKFLDEQGATISGIAKSDQDLDRFLFLNKGVSSGKLRGLNPFPGAEGEEMDSITARQARTVRQPGEGQISNYDAQQFVKGTVSRTKPYATNQNIVKAIKINNQQQRERVKFFSDYATVNNGSLNGALSAWIQYLEDNPIFDPTKPGSFQLNPNRKSYTDYFRSNASQGGANVKPFAKGGKVDLLRRLVEKFPRKPSPGFRDALHALEHPTPGSSWETADLPYLHETYEVTDPLEREYLAKRLSQITGASNAGAELPPRAISDEMRLQQVPPSPAFDPRNPPGKPSAGGLQEALDALNNPTPGYRWTADDLSYLLQNVLPADQAKIRQRLAEINRNVTEFKPKKAEGGEVKSQKRRPGEGTVLEDPPTARRRLQSAAQGLTYGLSDELAGLATELRGDGYEQGRDYVRRDLEAGGNEDPVGNFTSEVAGALPPTVAAGMVLKQITGKYDVKKVGTARSKTGKAIQLLARIAPKRKIFQAALAGGTAGGVAGLTSEGDAAQRLQRSKDGVIFGTVLGPVTAGATSAVGKVGRRVYDTLTNGSSMGAAERRIAEALAADNVSPVTVAQQASRDAAAGVPSRLADIGGARTQALAQSAASRDTAQAQALLKQTQDLQAGARGRVEDQINKGMKPDAFFDKEKDLVSQLRTNAQPLYDQAYKVNVVVQGDLADVLATPAGKKALQQAAIDMANDGVRAVAPVKTAQGTVVNTQLLDYTKRALGALVQRARSGTNPDDNAARIFGNLQSRLTKAVDDANPAYRKARAQYGDDAEVLGALRTGRDEILGLQPEQIAEKVAGLSFSARDALRTGVARALIEEVRSPRRAKNFAELINSPVTASQLTAVFERPADAKIFLSALRREADLYGTRATQARTATQIQGQRLRNELATNVPAQAVGAAGEGAGIASAAMGDMSGLGITARVLAALRNRIPLSDAAADDIARVFQTGSLADIKKMMANFEKYSALAKKRADFDAQLGASTSGATGAAYGSPSPQGYLDQQQ